MKTLFENMISMIVMVLIMFCFISVVSIQFQTIKASNIHTSALEAIQNSYYEINEDYLNNKIDNGYFEISDLQNGKQVVYHYNVSLPFVKYEKESEISGIAR